MTRLESNLEVGARIGKGHFCEVHTARDDVHGEVAVKILRQRIDECDADWMVRKSGLLS